MDGNISLSDSESLCESTESSLSTEAKKSLTKSNERGVIMTVVNARTMNIFIQQLVVTMNSLQRIDKDAEWSKNWDSYISAGIHRVKNFQRLGEIVFPDSLNPFDVHAKSFGDIIEALCSKLPILKDILDFHSHDDPGKTLEYCFVSTKVSQVKMFLIRKKNKKNSIDDEIYSSPPNMKYQGNHSPAVFETKMEQYKKQLGATSTTSDLEKLKKDARTDYKYNFEHGHDSNKDKMKELEDELKNLKDITILEKDLPNQLEKLLEDDSQTKTEPQLQNLQKLLRGIEESEVERELGKDSFSLMIVSGENHVWIIGILCFIIKSILGSLVIVDLFDQSNLGTKINLPLKGHPTLYIAQFLAIFLSIIINTDFFIAVITIRELPYSGKRLWGQITGLKTRRHQIFQLWWWRVFFPLFLKALQGLLMLVGTFCAIVQSKNIMDLVKSFSAMVIISIIDNLIFMIADAGHLGSELSAIASSVKEAAFETKIKKLDICKYSGLFFVFIIGFGVTVVFQASGRYVQQAYPTCPLNNVYDPQTNIKYLALIGDGVCQFSKGKGINVVECGWDDGDCEILNERYPACDVQEFSRLGDGKCDAGEYNSIFCGFDHGDCLRSNREIIKEFPNCTVSNPGWLGNGICNGGEYMKDCGNDFGDCNNCNVNNFLLIGNGNCNGGNYNTEECSFDGGDCLQKNKELQYKYRNCSVTNIGWIEDGFCDEGDYNIKECYFDGGDCVPSFALVGNEFEGPAKWDGAVKGEDGMIYGIPLNAKNILKFDPSSKTTSVIGDNFDSGSLKWRGGVNGHDGLIYGVPYNAEYVLQYDPKSEKISRIAEGHDLLISKAKFSGGVVAGDGQIYFMPFHFPQSIKFDPTNAVEPLKLVEGDFENVWGGVLGGDGNVYGIPHHGKKVTKITVENDEISFIGDDLSDLGDAKWSNGILGQDGNIYACPYNANQILQINILSQSTNLVGPDLGNDDSKWAGFVEGSDGFLYGIPSFSNKLLRFDPILHTATMIPLDDQLKNLEPLKTWSGAILDENGMIFMFPQDTKQILELTPLSLKQNF